MKAICHSPNPTTIQLQACADFFYRYSAEEYVGVLGLPERVQIVADHRELAKCFDNDDNSVCADSGSYHYLVLLDAHDFDIPRQIVAQAEHRHYSLKGVYPDTTIRLSPDVGTSANNSSALLLFHKTRQLILDGIHWNVRKSNVNPVYSPIPNSDDEPPQVEGLAIDVRNPSGPVVIRKNTFRHTGHQAHPFGFINIRNPSATNKRPDADLVEIRDNWVHSPGVNHNQGFYDLNDISRLFFIECRKQDKNSRRCEKTFAKIIGNIFIDCTKDPTEGEVDGSGLVSEATTMTASVTSSPGETPTDPEACGFIEHSAIELKNIGQFIIKNNYQKDSTALANIRIEYDDQQDIAVGGIARIIKDNVGHAIMTQGKISPTITITLDKARNNWKIINIIRMGANNGYTIRKQLIEPEQVDNSDSLPTSSEGVPLTWVTAGLIATAAGLTLTTFWLVLVYKSVPNQEAIVEDVLKITSMQ